MSTLDLSRLTGEQAVRFNRISIEIRQEFNDVVETASAEHFHNIDWIVGSVASRDKSISPLFRRLSSLAFVESELAGEHPPASVVVADRVLAQTLRRHIHNRSKSVRVRCTQGFASRTWDVFRPVRQYINGILMLVLRFAAKSKKSGAQLEPGRSLTLIDTFVLNNRTGDEGGITKGVYRDRYYPGLLEHLTDEERRGTYFLPTIIHFANPRRAFRLIRKASTPFLIHDDFLKFSDYLNVVLHPFRLLRCRIPPLKFKGFDVTRLVRSEHIRNSSDNATLVAMLYYRFASRLAEWDSEVQTLVIWYENQVIDRGLTVGFHRFHESTRVVAYQGIVATRSQHLCAFPNATELAGGSVPDVIYVVGEGFRSALYEFVDGITVDVAPGFRFQRLWQERQFSPDSDCYTILVGLPIDLGESRHILEVLSQRLPELRARQARFLVKPHPTWDVDQIARLLPDGWPDDFRFQTGPFHDALERSNLLVSNASSVSLEAAARGVPVVIIGGRSGIDEIPFPDNVSPDVWTLVRGADGCFDAIRNFQDLETSDGVDLIRLGESIRERFFEPVSRPGVAELLGFEP